MVALLPADIPAGWGGGRQRRFIRRQFLIRSKCAANSPSGARPNLEYETGEVKDRDRSGAKFRLRAETGEV